MNTPHTQTDAPSTASNQTSAAPRYHAFDAIRGAAMSFGVVLHGAIAYMAVPMPGLVWPVDESHSSRLIDWLFWWIHGFRIPLFFVVAGFFAVMLHNSRGGFLYLRHRTRRILYPLLLACVTILPLVAAAWVYGWIEAGTFTWDQIREREFADTTVGDNAEGLAHLWFLQYLYIYCLAFWLWRFIAARIGRRASDTGRVARLSRALYSHPLRPLWFALPTLALLAVDTNIVVDFKNSYVPTPMELIYNWLFFIAGTWLYAFRDRLGELSRHCRLCLAASLLAAAPMIILIHFKITAGLSTPAELGLAAATAAFCWLSIFAWMGLFLRWFDRHQPVVRWLSDSSYWVYLIHLPIVVVLQVWLTHISAPALVKFPVAVLIAYVICLMTYRLFVRYTAIGTLLNGRRNRHSRSGSIRAETTALEASPAAGK